MSTTLYSICEWRGHRHDGAWVVWVVHDWKGDIRFAAPNLERAIGWVWEHLYLATSWRH